MILKQYLALSRRSVIQIVRQPAVIIPSIIFPPIFLAMGAAALQRATDIPGFPQVDSFAQFGITATILQGALFGSTSAGSDMALDIERGFFDRLISSPVSRASILLARVTGAFLLGFAQALIYLIVGGLFGVKVVAGILGILLVGAVAALIAGGVGAILVAFGIRTGSAEAVQGAFPMIFVLLFLSSAFFPRELMNGWFKTAATINPISWLVEGIREQIITGLDWAKIGQSAAVALGLLALGLALAFASLRGRLAAHHG